MKLNSSRRFFLFFFLVLFSGVFLINGIIRGAEEPTAKERLLQGMHSISSHDLFQYVDDLCAERFGGRLTGTDTYNASAAWTAEKLTQWGVKPAGDNGTFFQDFPNPYTLVLDAGVLTLHIPQAKKSTLYKEYTYQTDYLPGSTSGSGKVTAEVIYVGYGITAPELGFDEYKGLDVKGKIVLVEREVPINPDKEPELFKKWRPYSFHQYKAKNAHEHGAAGMLYIYHIANPNCTYYSDLVLTYVADSVVNDLFTGTGKTHDKTVEKIDTLRKPHSFRTGKTVSMAVNTEHHADGIGKNVIGMVEGSDPELKKEVIILGAHLDHLGFNHLMMPGANDNASGVAVVMGVLKAMHLSELKPQRSVLVIFFGAEEQAVAGSDYYLQHPVVPLNQTKLLLNLDGVGRGNMLAALAGKTYPEFFEYIDDANQNYIHRILRATDFQNITRPRLDAARFMWAGVPSISFSTFGGEELPVPVYHKTLDNISIITPEIMEDLAQLLYIATMEIAGY